MAYQFPLNGGRINASIGGNSTSAGAGYTLVSTGTLLLAGGNNVTLSQNGSAITISGANQSNPNLSLYALGNTTQNSSTQLNVSNISFNGLGAATMGYSNGSIQVSVPTQTNQTLGMYGTGNTTGQSSSTTFDARSLTISGAGAASVGFSSSRMQISVPAASSLSVTGILSISNNGNTVSIGAPAFSAGMSTLGNTAGTTGTVSNQLIFAGGNNITLSQSTAAGGNTITISGPNQSNPNVSLYALGNTTQNSSTQLNVSNLSFNGLGAATVGYSNGSIQLSVPTQTNQTQGFTAGTTNGANTSLTSTGTFDARSVYLNAHGIVSAGFSNSSMFISATQSNQALSGSNGSLSFQTATFGNLNGLSFYTSNGSMVGSYTVPNVPAQSNQTLGLYAFGNTTQNSSTTLDARTLSFNGLGAATMGYSNGSIQVSAPPTSSLSVTGILSMSTNGSTVSLGVPAFSIGLSNIGNTSGTSGTASNQLILAGGNNITLSQSTAGTGNTITISAPNQSNQNISLYALGNTTQSSSTLLNASNLSFNGLGGVTVGYSNGSIQISGGAGGGGGIALANSQTTYTSGTANLVVAGGAMTIASTTGQSFNFSVPGTSSLSAGGALSISTNGSTISFNAPAASSLSGTGAVSISANGSTVSIGAPLNGTISNWEPIPANMGSMGSLTLTATGIQYFYKLQPEAYINASRLDQLAFMSLSSSSNSSHAAALTLAAGIYTMSGSTLSLITQSSGSATYQWSNTSNNSYASLTGLKGLTLPMNVSLTPGNYWLGLWQKTATTNANWATVGNMVFTNTTYVYNGVLGNAGNATVGVQENVGYHTSTQTALMGSAAVSQVIQSNFRSNFMPYIAFKNLTW